MERLRLIIRGRVQGVGFRYWALRQAQRLGLSGTVRNLPDGTVEVEAAGGSSQLETFRAALARGPGGAAVAAVEEREPGSTPLPGSFEIRH